MVTEEMVNKLVEVCRRQRAGLASLRERVEKLEHLGSICPPLADEWSEASWHARKAERASHQQFQLQKYGARGIGWDLTYDQWIGWWRDTGHYPERGRKSGQYIMARKDRSKPWALDNIECRRNA